MVDNASRQSVGHQHLTQPGSGELGPTRRRCAVGTLDGVPLSRETVIARLDRSAGRLGAVHRCLGELDGRMLRL